jgi:uncharacterized membrane protein (DUF441 family)
MIIPRYEAIGINAGMDIMTIDIVFSIRFGMLEIQIISNTAKKQVNKIAKKLNLKVFPNNLTK